MSEMSLSTYLQAQPRLDKRRRVLRVLMNILFPMLCKARVIGEDNVPAEGPVILMMNHISYVDPLIITATMQQRYVIAMAKVETLDSFLPRLLLRLWGNFVVKRGEIDRSALMNAIGIVQSGRCLLLAPEGTRHPQSGLREPRDGMAYIAAKADAVIVPVAVTGVLDWAASLKRLRRVQATVTYGRPFRFRIEKRINKTLRAQMMQEAMYQLAQTIPDDNAPLRGVYGDLDQATQQTLAFVDAPPLAR